MVHDPTSFDNLSEAQLHALSPLALQMRVFFYSATAIDKRTRDPEGYADVSAALDHAIAVWKARDWVMA